MNLKSQRLKVKKLKRLLTFYERELDALKGDLALLSQQQLRSQRRLMTELECQQSLDSIYASHHATALDTRQSAIHVMQQQDLKISEAKSAHQQATEQCNQQRIQIRKQLGKIQSISRHLDQLCEAVDTAFSKLDGQEADERYLSQWNEGVSE